MTTTHFAPPATSSMHEGRQALVDRLVRGEPYGLLLGGQGTPWLEALAALIRDFALEGELGQVVERAEHRLAPVAAELVRTGLDVAPLAWANMLTDEGEDSPWAPNDEVLSAPAVSLPGILLTQLAGLRALRAQGLDPHVTRPVGVAAHSQGALAAAALDGVDEADLYATACLVGAAVQLVAQRRGLLGATMLGVSGESPQRVADALSGLPDTARVVVGLRNGRRAVVLSGPEDGLRLAVDAIEERSAAEKDERRRKTTGGSPFAPVVEPIRSGVAFHHPDLTEAAQIAAGWAAACDLDPEVVRDLAYRSVVAPVDWVEAVDAVIDAGAHWLLDLGPADLATRLGSAQARGRGVGQIALATRRGHRELTTVGAAPRAQLPWTAFAPTVVTLPDGSTRAETRFSRLTGRSPVLLAGMTPTTVDPAIVAAAANAGFWAELAGGGLVSEAIFAENVAELDRLLEPGRTYSFNALYLDPYLWKLQIGGQRLVQKARASGSAVDAVVVSAGIPEPDDAADLVRELRQSGIEHVVFKPGTVRQIREVLAIADAVAPADVIIQIEGGRAGGHHSWEDLDDLLIATYADLRRRDNVVVCVGGGIGTADVAAAYLTGRWALAHDYPIMPLDGVLVGTAAMATLEATTAPAVKQLLVDTPGTPDWVGAGSASGGMASGRSQLGADIHEIDNTASRTGRLLDEVAGDAEAVAARRVEIVVALDATAKPYFGDVETMTYGGWLDRFVELCVGPQASAGAESAGQPGREEARGVEGRSAWLDITLRERFHAMLQRAEARLVTADRGTVPTLFATAEDAEDGAAALELLRRKHPAADDVVLHPADVPFFVQVCRAPGKPVPFVPILDADVRRWWRSDSLWQAHDARYAADEVCVIPGTVSVAGITRVDEPVAELLSRFEAATVDAVLTAGGTAHEVGGLRRTPNVSGPISLALAAPDVVWAGRTVRNPVHRLDAAGPQGWVLTDSDRAEHPGTGAALVADGAERVRLTVPLGGDDDCKFNVVLKVGDAVASGAAPVVTTDAAATAMRELLTTIAGGSIATVEEGRAVLEVAWHPDLGLDHAGAVGGAGVAVPDALVGLAWPAIFAVVGAAQSTSGDPVVEGLLDLVHLDHAIAAEAVPTVPTDIRVEAKLESVEDSELGRVLTIGVSLTSAGDPVATLRERFAVRGRGGVATVDEPARAGGTLDAVRETPRRSRVDETLVAPSDLRAFAAVSGDHNPIHTSLAAARLAGLDEPIVHGMWLSGAAEQLVARTTGRRLVGWTARWLSPLRLGATVGVRADRVGLQDGDELLEVTCRADGEVVMAATVRCAAPRTAYVFPGQGIQHRGMGMDGYQRSKAARAVWDRAETHTRDALGFSILTVVRDNPSVLVADGVTHRHPDGVLFLTQFTQVAMAVLGAAQMAELRESGAFVEGSVLAGHSVGEYNALAAVSGAIALEAVVEVVFQRGSVMHRLVDRDADGNSDYRLAAIRPSQIGLGDDEVNPYIEGLAERTGEFLQIVNYNLRGSQYAIAGTVRGLEALEKDVADRRARTGGKAAFVLVPGIDVPFHSRVLHGGVPDFRARLDELLPAEIDPTILQGRYLPNLVPRPFSLEHDFVAEVSEYVSGTGDEGPLAAVLANFDVWAATPGRLCRTLLIELLAWQFASPVRWIETQDLMFASLEQGGLGVERLVEIGVAQSPTVANLAASTLKLPEVQRTLGAPVEVLNIERDAGAVLATDEEPAAPEEEEPERAMEDTSSPAAEPTPAAASTMPAPTGGPRPDDLPFTAADATTALLAWWTKTRPEQIGAADSIESLCDGASSRRNQLLVDLGGELNLGAIDGAGEADVPTLRQQVTGLARRYQPFGPVLKETFSGHLKKIVGPTGRKQSAVADRVRDTWQLGDGWGSHTVAELALATREGASVRGGDLATITAPTTAAEVDAVIDAALQSVAARQGVSVDLPPTGSGDATVDAAALAEITGEITGADGILASTARHLLARLELSDDDEASGPEHDATVLAQIEAELGPDWLSRTAPVFDPRRAVLLDDRWASAREDLARLASGADVEGSFLGAGEIVARQADWWDAHTGDSALSARLGRAAREARVVGRGEWADEVAVVTGAGPHSIAASAVARLLTGGATVVVTTSVLDGGRLAMYKDLYRRHARVGASLWIVPANMASFVDVDALASWIIEEQTRTAGGSTTIIKPGLVPTLLLPFAAGRVQGELPDAGARSEIDTRILLWSVERLLGRLATTGRAHDLAARLHVVLPGSPNRGMFGGDGAYGEAKAALDAVAARWHSERTWGERVTIVHAIIGWVRGTGLMGAIDPLVEAVEDAGVRTWTPDQMAEQLLGLCDAESRREAQVAPLTVDLTGGLADVDLDLRAFAAEAEAEAETEAEAGPSDLAAEPAPEGIAALASSPAQLPEVASPRWGDMPARPEDLVVIVGAGELGPYGSARTRFEMEVDDELSAAGVLELAWSTGLLVWDDQTHCWHDGETGDPVDESEVHERYHDLVVERCGIRRFGDDHTMVDGTAPLLTSVFLDEDLTFAVGSEAEAQSMRDADPERTRVREGADGEWMVTRRAGAEIRVPRRMRLSRTVGGQIPTGFDPAVWGVPTEMLEATDRVAVWNLVCTVDAFLSSGFTPAELMRWVHPAHVANTQGTGMGGMSSMQALYTNTLLGESNPNDILQEALPNVIAAHVVQSYVGSYGSMIHPVAACATTAVSVEEGVDKIRLGKAEFVVAGGFDDLGVEGIIGFADMSATADTEAMRAQGIDDRDLSRANDRRRGGFVESQGGGTLLLARGDVAARMGLPVQAVVAYASSFGDGLHTSIPAPGIGALAAGLGGHASPLARALADVGLTVDDVAVVSKHDTSTAANDPNESELHERLAAALGRSDGNPLFVISQKSLTGHAKGGAAAFQLSGLCQVLASGKIPPNRSLDCVDDALAEHEHLVWLREPLRHDGIRAGLVTSLGFGHVSGLIALAHPQAFVAALAGDEREAYLAASQRRAMEGRLRLARAMTGGPPAYERPPDRRLGGAPRKANGTAGSAAQGAASLTADAVRSLEAEVLLDPQARLGEDGAYSTTNRR